jgi:hypothetical protein
VLGVAAAHSTHRNVLAGLAGLVAGAMSMAAGVYVSVHSQADLKRWLGILESSGFDLNVRAKGWSLFFMAGEIRAVVQPGQYDSLLTSSDGNIAES